MKILGIETSCDETAVSVVDEDIILSSVVASQDSIHAKYGGVVPELASRRHIEVIVPLLNEALLQANISLEDVEGIAVTRSPGLIGSLLVGLSIAKALAYALRIPLVGVNHLEGHINAVHLSQKEVPYPHIGLIVSGGHTSLYIVHDFGHYQLLGATRDDAAGEAFDKVARLLGLGYPGGPIIDELAPMGNPEAVEFRPPKFRDLAEFDFSFSGIKTAVMFEYKRLASSTKPRDEDIRNLAASFQKAIVEFLVKNTVKAAKQYGCRYAVVSGGVAANQSLRSRLKEVEKEDGIEILIPPMELCTDNAAMIAYVGGRRLLAGQRDDHNLNATAVDEIGV